MMKLWGCLGICWR